MDDFVIMAQKRHQLRRAVKCVHEVLGRLGLRLHGSKRLIGKLSKGFDFLGYRVVPGRRLRSSAESKRRFAEKFRRLYEQGADSMRLWRYAERWCRWRRAGLDGLVSLKGGLRRVVIRQLRMLERPQPWRKYRGLSNSRAVPAAIGKDTQHALDLLSHFDSSVRPFPFRL